MGSIEVGVEGEEGEAASLEKAMAVFDTEGSLEGSLEGTIEADRE